MRKLNVAALVVASLVATVAGAQPVQNVDPNRHPNLAAAQRLSVQAWEKVSAAQAANKNKLDGHGQRAKELLEQVNVELRLAAAASDRNMKK
jgi:hypothetical protein